MKFVIRMKIQGMLVLIPVAQVIILCLCFMGKIISDMIMMMFIHLHLIAVSEIFTSIKTISGELF